MIMHRIIINADDFGINEVVTREIERMIEQGSISSTTIMANGECLEEVAAFAKAHPEISYGTHLCLSEFESLTKSPVFLKYGIMNDEGYFIRMAIFGIHRFRCDLLDAIRDELYAQIKVIKSLGIPLSHCDSHHHVHTIYGLHSTFEQVIKDTGFTKVRIPRDVYRHDLWRHPCISQKQLAVIRFYKSTCTTTDAFCSYSEYMRNPRKYEGQTIELMCHPGHERFANEYQMVQKQIALQGNEVKLITYNEL